MTAGTGRFPDEKAYETYLGNHFAEHGCMVVHQAWCNVFNDGGAKDGGRRRADLHITFPEPVDGWLRAMVVEVKATAGDIRAGSYQTVAYMHAFDWRTGPSRHDGGRLARPDIALLSAPELLTRIDGDAWVSGIERYLWDNGCAILRAHRGDPPGTFFRLIERSHLLTGRWRGAA